MAKDAKNKKENKRFFKDFKAELKKVIWPTPKQLVNNTVAVITIVLITAVIVFVLDSVFKVMNTYGINKIKEAVDSRNEISNELEDEETTDNETTEEETVEENAIQEETTQEETENKQQEEQKETTENVLQEENAEQIQ